jgi:hypothetical protein
MYIGVDFDGTCVTHEFPKVGKDVGAVPVLKELVESGHKLVLFTMRSDGQVYGDVLADAVNWFKENDIPLYGIQRNPTQDSWTTSPKAYAQVYIDDAALGCPLLETDLSSRPYVDWVKVREWFEEQGFLK